MRQRGWGVWSAVLLAACLSTPVRAGDEPAAPKKEDDKGWFPWLKSKDDKPGEKPADKPEKPLDLSKPNTAPSRPPADAGSVKRAREEAALLRRLAVCDQLMLVAIQTKDDDLLHQAEKLDKRVREVYALKTADLPATRAASQVLGGDDRSASASVRPADGKGEKP